MKTPILLIGGGGHCHSCIDVIESEGRMSIAGIVDPLLVRGSEVLGYFVYGNDDLPRLIARTPNVLITVGQIKSADTRVRIYHDLCRLGAKFPTVISPHAIVSRHADIGRGTIVHHGAIVNAAAYVGHYCIINSKALIEHDAYISDFSHVSTGAIVNGGCYVDEGSFVGSNAVIKQGTRLAPRSIVGFGGKR